MRDISLAGKVVLVTGAARGIGQAIARQATVCGANVACCDLLSAESNTRKGVLSLTGDVTREEDCGRFVARTVSEFGRLDVLVNNAGILEPSRPTVRQDLATWRTVVDVNLQGSYLMAQAAARQMIAQGSPGAIVNISSVAGLSGFRAQNAYGVAKAAVAMLTKTLATDLAANGIRVNAIAPGFINSAMTENLGDTTKIGKSAFINRIPMGRFGDPEEVAKAVVFLASDWADYITGAILPVDGGWLAFGGPSET